jgi:uncharacterized protein YndB with AHSA1/START domain
MGVAEFELERTISAPVDAVFDRLADIEGYHSWMPDKGSILHATKLTSPGEPGLGSTYLDETSYGATPGEIAEFERPTRIVFHWWDDYRSGRRKMEGWPGYTLAARDDGTTHVRHGARLQTYGVYRLATPVLRRIAKKERTATLAALAASFEA